MSLLDKTELTDISHKVENKTESLNKCDICEFESENKKLMTSHMIDDHDATCAISTLKPNGLKNITMNSSTRNIVT